MMERGGGRGESEDQRQLTSDVGASSLADAWPGTKVPLPPPLVNAASTDFIAEVIVAAWFVRIVRSWNSVIAGTADRFVLDLFRDLVSMGRG
jgi:hypothetical protein